MAVAAPTLIEVTARTAHLIHLYWENNDSYHEIQIWRNADPPDAGYELHATISGKFEFWRDVDCIPEVEYCYKLKGGRFFPVKGGEESGYSNVLCATTFLLTEEPSDCVATPISDTTIDVYFTDNSLSEIFHRLRRKLGAGAWGLVTNLKPNRDSFRDQSHVLMLAAGGYVACDGLDIGKQVKDDGDEIGILLSYDNTARRWTIDSSTIIANASTMTITGGTGGGTANGASVGIVADSLYTYQVRAETPATANTASAQVVTFDKPTAPVLAAILDADTQDKSIRIRWPGVVEGPWKTATLYHVNDWVTNDGISYICIHEHTSDAPKEPGIGISWIAEWEMVTGYKIERDKDAEGYAEIATIGAEMNNYLATGLTPGATYSFKIQAYNAAGDSGYSNIVSKDALATYVPTAFEKWIRDPNIEPVYLAEIYTKMTLTPFIEHDAPCWKKTIGADDRGIDILEVFENGTAYALVADPAAVKATANTFFFNYDTRVLYIHATGDADPAGFFIEGAFWLYFSTHKDIELKDINFDVNGRLNHYLPLLARENVPDVTQEIKPYFEGSFGLGSGSIAFINAKIGGAYFFDIKFATYTWINAKVILKAGSDTFSYAQFREVFTAYINDKDCSDAKIKFSLRDIREDMGNNIILNKFDTVNYPDVEERFEDKPIPIYFGNQDLITPVVIDATAGRVKCNDGRIKSIDAVYKNDIRLDPATQYYVDFQRATVTLARDGTFVIVAGVNDKIDFQEDAGELTATLDPGYYTAFELAAEIRDKMSAVGTLYRVIWPPTVGEKCTISSAPKFPFTLLWKTGTNGPDGTNRSVASTIGFSDDADDEDDYSYTADESVIGLTESDIIEVQHTGLVNSADEVIYNGAEIFKYLMNKHKGLSNAELDLDSIYEAKYANERELAVPIEREEPFDGIVRTIEHSIEAFTFQDELGRLGIRPRQTTVASNVKYVVSSHIFDHSQRKDKSSLYWKVNIYYDQNLQTDDWREKIATKNVINWQYNVTEGLDIYTYLRDPLYAQALATSILDLLNKEQVVGELPMLLFDVRAGDLIKFSRTRFYDSDGTASEITLRVLRISKSLALGRTSITAEVVS